MAKRLQIKEGTIPKNTIYEICYKNDALNDPLINDHHAVALDLCTYDDLEHMYALTKQINDILQAVFIKQNIILVDFKIEFGKRNDGTLVLADEISPDTCRFWDKNTLEKLDKDRFRRDLGSIEEAYVEILNRINM
jgi:phosphoribosylaminoimidazole-succinocarboxamide synthase